MAILRKTYEIITQEGLIALFYKIIIWKQNRNFVKLMAQKQWDKAIIIGEKLIRILPKKIGYYQGVARCYKKLGHDEIATNILQKGLTILIEPVKVLEILHENDENATCLKSNYLYMGGEQNLGCIEHTILVNGETHNHLTKISTITGLEKEKIFYSKIYRQYPNLREITPEFFHFTELNNEKLSLITMEKIEGTEPILNENMIKKIVKANQIISSNKFYQLKNIMKPVFDKDIRLVYDNYPNHPISVLHSFVSIHKKSTNQKLFYLVFKRMKEMKYSIESYKYMKRLEKVIIDMQMYDLLDTEVHYSLQHGDFNETNMLVDNQSGKLFIIDWGNMMIGPSWMDIAGFLGQLKKTFHYIETNYLFDDLSSHLEPIEKLFFIYTLIFTWFIVFTQFEFDNNLDMFVRPAVEFVEKMGFEIVNQGFINGEM